MATRRMDISSLLCNDNDNDDNDDEDDDDDHINQPVILAPHLRGKHMATTKIILDVDCQHRPRSSTIDALLHHPRPSSSQSQSVNALLNPRPSSTSTSSPFPYLQKSPPPLPPRTGLDALVHAASEERRRISSGSSASEASSPPIDRSLRLHAADTPLDRPLPRPYPFSYTSPSLTAHNITDDSPRPHKRFRQSPSPPLEHHHHPALTSALSSSLTGPGIHLSPHVSSPATIMPLSGPGITPLHYQPSASLPPLLPPAPRHPSTRMSPIVYAPIPPDREVPRLARAVWNEEEIDDVRRCEREREPEDVVRTREREDAQRHKEQIRDREEARMTEREDYEFRQRHHDLPLEQHDDNELRHRQDIELRQRQQMDIRQRQEFDLRLRQGIDLRHRHRDSPDLTQLRQREDILWQQELERRKGQELLWAQEETAAWHVNEMRGRRKASHQSPHDDSQRQKRDRSLHRQPQEPSLHRSKHDTSLHCPRDPSVHKGDIDSLYGEQLTRQREQELLRQQDLDFSPCEGEELLRQQEDAAARQVDEMRVRQAAQCRREEIALRQKLERDAQASRREDERLHAEAEQRQREELARKRREEEFENRRREEDLELRRAAEELDRRRQEEELERRRHEEETQRRRQEEEIERRRQEEETQRRRQEEKIERRRQEEEIEHRRKEEDAQRQRAAEVERLRAEAELRQRAEAERAELEHRQRLEREQRRREEEQKCQEELERMQREVMLHRQREEALLKQREEARKQREEEDRRRKLREQAEKKEREEIERRRLEEVGRKQWEEMQCQRAELERKQLEEAEIQQREAAERLRLAEEFERKQQEDFQRKQREDLVHQQLAEEQRQREELQWKQREEALRRQQEELALQQQQELERRQQLEQMQSDEDLDLDMGQDADTEVSAEGEVRDHQPRQDSRQSQSPDASIPPAPTSTSPVVQGSFPTLDDSAERHLPPMHRGKVKEVHSPVPSAIPSKVEEQEMRVPSAAPTDTQRPVSPTSPLHQATSHMSPARLSPACLSPQHKDDPSSMDVDEELLSLVEDLPTSHPTTLRPKLERSPSPPRPSILDEEIMPPPLSAPAPAKKKAESVKAGKKKGTIPPKPALKPKPPTKPRAKPPLKAKGREPTPKDFLKNSLLAKHATTSRSRSASEIPVNVKEEPEADEDSDREDDKLYCVCKTRYDEDRVMIACDRCDEWYHTQCVNMPDLEVDLVDQFICPLCIQTNVNPELHLQTTYKRRCFFGLRHTDPSSPSACHKPSRGAFSKYCSDECGIKYMQMRIIQWECGGGKRDRLWESVKDTEKREGVVVRTDGKPSPSPLSAQKRKADREIAQLNVRLENVVREREMVKHEMDLVVWRERLVGLASERAERMDECGWDQRLCFGEEEWFDFGAEVLESYEDKGKEEAMADATEDAMPVDGITSSDGEWWCTGKKKCERHAGWQKLRAAEVGFEKETKETIICNLTACEREIRKGIEDMLYPQTSNTSQ